MIRLAVVILFASACFCRPAAAQPLPAESEIAAAVSPLPQEYRDGAEVRVRSENGWTIVREGSNEMICLSDEPGDDRFHVACYHNSLEPFMERGRELRADGLDRERIQEIREEEARSGELDMPDQPAALYSLTGPPDSFDSKTMTVSGATPLYVVYMPYATTETTGLPAQAPRGQPWLMNPGKPWAHIMLVGPEPSGNDDD